MIRCIAIDDEPLALQQLGTYLRKVPFFQVVECCQSALDAIPFIEQKAIDVVFIDINMPDLSGLDFVKSLDNPPMIVFTTAYQEYALDGYKVDAVDYLLKPFGMSDILKAANKVKRRYELKASSPSFESSDVMFLKTEYKVVRILVSDIIMIEGMSEYLRIYLHDQEKPIIVLMSMKKMEERLAKHSFMRVHKSYIINLNSIRELNKSRILLDNGADVPIGDSYRDRLGDYISQKLLGK